MISVCYLCWLSVPSTKLVQSAMSTLSVHSPAYIARRNPPKVSVYPITWLNITHYLSQKHGELDWNVTKVLSTIAQRFNKNNVVCCKILATFTNYITILVDNIKRSIKCLEWRIYLSYSLSSSKSHNSILPLKVTNIRTNTDKTMPNL